MDNLAETRLILNVLSSQGKIVTVASPTRWTFPMLTKHPHTQSPLFLCLSVQLVVKSLKPRKIYREIERRKQLMTNWGPEMRSQ